MKRKLPVAAVLMAAVSWLFAVATSPIAARPETAPVPTAAGTSSPASAPGAAAAAPPAGASTVQEPPFPEIAESSERFTTGCGWCDQQVSELGGTCLGLCGEHSIGVSCAAAGEGEGAVDALLSRERRHRSPIEDVREVWCTSPAAARASATLPAICAR